MQWCWDRPEKQTRIFPRRCKAVVKPFSRLRFSARLRLFHVPSSPRLCQAAAKATQEQLGPRTKIRIAQNKKVRLIVPDVERSWYSSTIQQEGILVGIVPSCWSRGAAYLLFADVVASQGVPCVRQLTFREDISVKRFASSE